MADRVGLVEERRLQGDFTAAVQYIKAAYRTEGERLLTRPCSDRTRSGGFKLKKSRFRLDIRKKYFMMRVVRQPSNPNHSMTLWWSKALNAALPCPRMMQVQAEYGSSGQREVSHTCWGQGATVYLCLIQINLHRWLIQQRQLES